MKSYNWNTWENSVKFLKIMGENRFNSNKMSDEIIEFWKMSKKLDLEKISPKISDWKK